MDAEKSLSLVARAEQEVNRAKRERIISSFSIAKGTTNAMLLRGPLAKTICMRLVALQYLTRDEVEDNLAATQDALKRGQSSEWLSRFERAVRLLQTEAGLKQDAWLSAKTFNAIQNVYSFEDVTDISHWNEPHFKHFFNRAKFARLNVLGLISPDQITELSGSDQPTEQQYMQLDTIVSASFDLFLNLMSHIDQTLNVTGSSGLATNLLFDTDELTNMLAMRSASLAQRLRQVQQPFSWGKSDLDLSALLLRFVMAQARIETWLNGYGSEIKNGSKSAVFDPGNELSARTYSRQLAPGQSMPRDASDVRLTPEVKRMVAFWDDAHRLTKSRGHTYSISRLRNEIGKNRIKNPGIALRTLRYANALNREQESVQAEKAEVINEQVAALDEESLTSKVWQEEQGASLLDGVKRAWRWLVGKAKKVFRFFTDKLRILVRAVKGLAVNGLEWFRKLGLVFANATKHIMRKHWFDSPVASVVRDTDFDVMVLIHPEARLSQALEAGNTVVRRTNQFKAASALTFLITTAMRKLAGIFANPLLGTIRALLLLMNFDKLLSEEDRQTIQLAFEQTHLKRH